jgi:PGF-pre-PGF domain-containing protein
MMKTGKSIWENLFIIAILIVLITASFVPVQALVPTISNLNNPVIEKQNVTVIDSDVSISNPDGTGFGGGYIEFSLANSGIYDDFNVTSSGTPNTNGEISVSGSDVYIGNGTATNKIGTINSTFNGQDGQKLLINFVAETATLPTNNNFETGNTSGWTINTTVSSVTSTPELLAAITNDTDLSNTGDIANQNSIIDTDASQGTYSLKIYNSGTTASGYGNIWGPSATSSSFTASAGSNILFDWKATQTSDYYIAYALLVDNQHGTTIVLFANESMSSNWQTEEVIVSQDSNDLQFQFILGGYDYSGGKAVGASMHIDNIRALSLADSVVTSLSRAVTYNYTGGSPSGNVVSGRTLTITTLDKDGESASSTATISVYGNSPYFNSGDSFSINENETSLTNVLYDAQADNGDGGSNDTNISYSFSGGDGHTLFNIDSDDGEVRLNSVGVSTLDYETKSNYTLQIQADDGQPINNTANKTVNVTVNDVNDAPGVPGAFTLPTNGQIIPGNELITVSWGYSTDPDDGDTVKYDLWYFNGTWTKIGNLLASASMAYNLPDDNTNSAMFRVYANDTLLNSSARETTFTVDTTPPIVPTITVPTDGSTLNTTYTWVNGTTSADTANVTIYVNGSITNNSVSVSGSIFNISNVPLGADGAHEINVSAKDASGNINTTNATVTVTVDTTAPVWSPVPSDQTVELGDSFSYDVNATDLQTITYAVNDTTNFSIGSSNGTITNNVSLSLGIYSLNITATDPAGNQVSKTINVTVQYTAPVSSGGGGSGTGGSGVVSSEPHENIAKYETQTKKLNAGVPTSYSFTSPDSIIYQVIVTGKENINDVSFRIEILKGQSTRIQVPPPGTVYRHANILAGTNLIKGASVKFKVENKWFEDKKIASGEINLVKWNGNEWIILDIKDFGSDGRFSHFEAQTESFSSFAITGIKAAATPTAASPQATVAKTQVTPTTTPITAPTKKASGNGIWLAIILVLALAGIYAVYLHRRKRR